MPFPEYVQYPPKNREAEELSLPLIEIVDAEKTYRTNSNALVGCVIWGATGEQQRSGEGNLRDDVDGAAVFNPLALVAREDVPSFLSGEPSVRIRMEDLAIDVSPEELLRLIARALRVDEFMTLRDHFGMFYDIHADYYDQRTGRSKNPMRSLYGDEPAPALRPAPRM